MRVNIVAYIWIKWPFGLRDIHLLNIRALIEASLIHDLRMLRLDTISVQSVNQLLCLIYRRAVKMILAKLSFASTNH